MPPEKEAAPTERPRSIDAFLAADRMMVIAHRGFSGNAPENTLVAIRQAMDLGADMVEIDVTLSGDGHVIVLHDETLDRTTDGEGPAMESPLEEIRRLDAGSWFDPQYAGEPVPTLDEVLELVAGEILLNIEIKSEAVTEEARGGIAEKVAELVRRRKMTEQVIISSFHPLALAHMRELAPDIRTASLYNRKLHRGQLPSQVTGEVGSVGFNVNGRLLNEAMLKDLRAHGIPLAVYTVNEKRHMRKMLELEVDAVFTDRPDRLLELLERRRAD